MMPVKDKSAKTICPVPENNRKFGKYLWGRTQPPMTLSVSVGTNNIFCRLWEAHHISFFTAGSAPHKPFFVWVRVGH